MKLIIDISEEIYKEAKEQDVPFEHLLPLCQSIENGTPLPKGHGKLIDADRLKTHIRVCGDEWYEVAIDFVEGSPTIIEADKENE